MNIAGIAHFHAKEAKQLNSEKLIQILKPTSYFFADIPYKFFVTQAINEIIERTVHLILILYILQKYNPLDCETETVSYLLCE